MSKRKPYNYVKKNRTTTPNLEKKKNKLENTTRIRIDQERLNDSYSLDTSFLEGRVQKKVEDNVSEKEKILEEAKEEKKSSKSIVVSLIGLVVITIILFVVYFAFSRSSYLSPKKDNDKEDQEQMVMDHNYLFLGDFYISDMDFQEFNYPYVIVSDDKMDTTTLMNHLHDDVYIYNPSHIILHVGLQDLVNQSIEEDVLDRLQKIILTIKESRPNAKIYIESLGPIDQENVNYPKEYSTITNDMIHSFNQLLENRASSLNVNYIDLYAPLSYMKALRENYTEDGLHLNQDGYERVWKVLKRIIHNS